MQKYKDELNRFHLNEQQLQELKDYVSHHEEEKKPRNINRKAMVCFAVTILLCITSLVWFLQKPLKRYGLSSISLSSINEMQNKINYMMAVYEPSGYSFLGGFGGAGIFGLLQSDTLDEIGRTHPVVKKLPVYRYEQFKDNTGQTYQYTEEDYLNIITELKQKLSIETEIEKDSMGRYVIDDEQMRIEIREDASIVIQIKEKLDPSIVNNSRSTEAYARKYLSYYEQIAKITSPVYHLSESAAGNYEVIVTQKSDQLSIYEEGKAPIVFSITQRIGEESNQVEYCPQIMINHIDNLTYIDEFPIMSLEDAKHVLLNGGYYYSLKRTEFNENDIVGYDMVYPDLETVMTFLPYRVPVYRFYIQKAEGIYRCDVVAIEQDALSSLDEVLLPWYMEAEN